MGAATCIVDYRTAKLVERRTESMSDHAAEMVARELLESGEAIQVRLVPVGVEFAQPLPQTKVRPALD